MFIEITTAYTAQYSDPIGFEAGEAIQVGREDSESPNWLWCRAPSGKEGWVHRSFLAAAESGTTTSIKAYTAKELTVAIGDRGTLVCSLDGWLFIRLESREEGWIPQSHAEFTSQ